MLKVIRSMAELHFGNLMEIYAQSNEEHGKYWSGEQKDRCIALAEQEFYAYLRQCFFTLPDSRYFLWEVCGKPVSAVRCESYRDGFLLTALETDPCYRGEGHATALLEAVLCYLEKKNIYAHIHHNNTASVSVHLKCGFEKVSTGARMLDGSYSTEYDTYLWNL